MSLHDRFIVQPALPKEIDWTVEPSEVIAIIFDGRGARVGAAVGDWREDLRIVADRGSRIDVGVALTLVFRPCRDESAASFRHDATEIASS